MTQASVLHVWMVKGRYRVCVKCGVRFEIGKAIRKYQHADGRLTDGAGACLASVEKEGSP